MASIASNARIAATKHGAVDYILYVVVTVRCEKKVPRREQSGVCSVPTTTTGGGVYIYSPRLHHAVYAHS